VTSATHFGDRLFSASVFGGSRYLPRATGRINETTWDESPTRSWWEGERFATNRGDARMACQATSGIDPAAKANAAQSGGPVVNKPTRQGFGTSVIERMIRHQLRGEMQFDWRPEGLACEITFAL
jgi:hypothetical protein